MPIVATLRRANATHAPANAEEFNLDPFQANAGRHNRRYGAGISQQNEPSAAMTAPKSDLPTSKAGDIGTLLCARLIPPKRMANRL